jgi:hypothetical protein
MVRSAERMRGVFQEVQPPVRGQFGRQPPLALLPIDHMEIPGEHVDAQRAPPDQQAVQELAESVGPAVRCAVDQQPNAAVEVPPHDDDRLAGLLRRLAEGVEIGVAVDEECGPLGSFDAPAVAPGPEDRRSRTGLGRPAGHSRARLRWPGRHTVSSRLPMPAVRHPWPPSPCASVVRGKNANEMPFAVSRPETRRKLTRRTCGLHACSLSALRGRLDELSAARHPVRRPRPAQQAGRRSSNR